MNFLTNLIPLPYRIAALALFAAALVAFGWVKGAEHAERKADAYRVSVERQVDAAAARATVATATLKTQAAALQEITNEKAHSIQLRLDTALRELRSRPERAADTPERATACAGSDGRELSGPDAEFLSRFAADAARQQDERNQCIQQYNAVREALMKLAPP